MNKLKIFIFIILSSLIVSCSGGANKKTDAIVIGTWNDKMVGENEGIYIKGDGTGNFISLGCYSFTWEFDNKTNILTTEHIRQRDKSLQKVIYTYIPEKDILIKNDARVKEHIFWRASKE